MNHYTMTDVLPLIGQPPPPQGRESYYIACPSCDSGQKKHLNVNLTKGVFRCPRCGVQGGIFDLFSLFSGIHSRDAKAAIDQRLSGQRESLPRLAPPAVQESPVADIDQRHRTYTLLLESLRLSPLHRENLLRRGLTDTDISALQYKSAPFIGGGILGRRLAESGFDLSGVPGFYRDKSGCWSFVSGKCGILIPVRDLQGRIQGLQIRLDDVNKRKFRWISSTERPGGCKAEGWVHLAGPAQPCVLLTEGGMKADVIHALTGKTVVAVPGVNSLGHLEKALKALKTQGLERVMTCFDMDFLSNPHVQKGYLALTRLLDEMEVPFGTYMWDPAFKGLDDYVWAKRQKSEGTN